MTKEGGTHGRLNNARRNRARPDLPQRRRNPSPGLSRADQSLGEVEKAKRQVALAYAAIGKALSEIRDKKLYRAWGNWDTYLREKWDYGRAYAKHIIDYAAEVDRLLPVVDDPRLLPTESAGRDTIRKESTEDARAIYRLALEFAGGKKPKKKHLEKARTAIKEPKSRKMAREQPEKWGGLIEDPNKDPRELADSFPEAVTERSGNTARFAVADKLLLTRVAQHVGMSELGLLATALNEYIRNHNLPFRELLTPEQWLEIREAIVKKTG